MWTNKTVFKGIIVYNILNILDIIFTLVWFLYGAAVEINPIMNKLLIISPILFGATKFIAGGIVSLLIWRMRNSVGAKICLVIAFSIYGAILLFNLVLVGIGIFAPL